MSRLATNVIILSLPRSGSSMLAALVSSAGYRLTLSPDSSFSSASEFNVDGYNEEVALTLLNDQIIRMKWGLHASNLHIPLSASALDNSLPKNGGDFRYDLDEHSVYFPDQFFERIEEYTGTTWDVWGLTRMQPGQKWYRAYSRNLVSTGSEVIRKITGYSSLLNEGELGAVVKDPRLGLTLPHYNLSTARNRIITICRAPQAVMNSMRRHYGQRLFTTNFLPGPRQIVSNHFNYHIGYQPFREYWDLYNVMMSRATEGFETLDLEYEKVVDGSQVHVLEAFIGRAVSRSLIKHAEKHLK
jgi:hypothetical protein